MGRLIFFCARDGKEAVKVASPQRKVSFMKTLLSITSVLLMGSFLSASVYAEEVDLAKYYQITPKAAQMTKGSSTKASFEMSLKGGAKVHPQAPFQCKISTTAGLLSSKQKLGHKDKESTPDHKKVVVPVQITAKESGTQSVQMGCSFYICLKDICARRKADVKIDVTVK
jgi:hypothetical protein